MVEGTSERIPFDDFKKVLANVLMIEEEKLVPETSFTADLYVDSIRWVEMALRIEQLGVDMPAEAFWEIQTVGDAYKYYVSHHAVSA